MYHRGGQIIQGICNSTAALVFEAEHKAMTYREIANPPPRHRHLRRVQLGRTGTTLLHLCRWTRFHLTADTSYHALKAGKENMLLDTAAAIYRILYEELAEGQFKGL